jgi:hypothetical protein
LEKGFIFSEEVFLFTLPHFQMSTPESKNPSRGSVTPLRWNQIPYWKSIPMVTAQE